MLFHTLDFAIFFIIVFSSYLILQNRLRYQNLMLVVASYVFYGWWDWRYLSLLLISTITDYYCALLINKYECALKRKRIVSVSIFVNLSILGIFKYYDFFAESFQDFVGLAGIEVTPIFLDLVLPAGISFYTFQTMSYSLDVYRNKVKPVTHFIDFALYVSFFPQLIAGPIERGERLVPQLISPRKVTWENIYKGMHLFIWGLFIKVFVADNLANLVDPVFSSEGPYDGATVLLATYAFSFQIYGDFAGYSFMAIGLAEAMGIKLMENFRRPYFSRNISDFWRRWHISLSSWFRDYVFSPYYIHMSKKKIFAKLSYAQRHFIVFFITLTLTEIVLGLWHGAGWNYVAFGAYHGVMIGSYYFIKNYWNRMNIVLQILLTYNLACIGWLIFRSETLAQAGEMFWAILFNFQITRELNLSLMAIQLLSFILPLVFVQFFKERANDSLVVLKWPVFFRYTLVVTVLFLTIVMGNFANRPFIYFQF